MIKPAIIVHGGAGDWERRGDRFGVAVAGCAEAAAAGQAVLLAGGSALDAVEAATRVLEDCPATDAGRGSYLNSGGEIEMDAFIMDGQTLNMGAVGAVCRVRYPITLARRVMTDTNHNLLVGAGAEAFADQLGIPRCSTEDLLTGDEIARYHHLRRDGLLITQEGMDLEELTGTVGAVAIDRQGNLAAATSTGGTKNKLPGRVGDTPLAGAGGYADNQTAAVSATGHGESIMKVLLSKLVCDYVGQGLPAGVACEFAVRFLSERVQGRGGVIAVDRSGRTGFALNTTAMPYAYAHDNRPVVSGPESL